MRRKGRQEEQAVEATEVAFWDTLVNEAEEEN
jgi:hypothetical protein